MKTPVLLFYIALALLVPVCLINAQTKPAKTLKPIAADCKTAVKLPFEKKYTYGPTVAPNGPGEKNEIKSGKKNDLYFFEKEHNSAWYYFDVTVNGVLAIKITPVNPKDDYDFILFKYTDSCFCDNLIKKKIIPVRTNISRTGLGGSEITGMSKLAVNEFVHDGAGDQFSKSLEVKKGERYYLVLDNVYPKGDGHTIELGFERELKLSGTVLNEQQKPLKAEVALEDWKGNEVAKTFSDSITGKYNFSATVWVSESYNLTFSNDSSFVETTVLKMADLANAKYIINDIKTVLPVLKGGKKYTLDGINFYGNSARILPESYSSVKSLYKLMRKNKKMSIRIEGHVNLPGRAIAGEVEQNLSDKRAETIYNYLMERGIEKERMTTIGFSNKFMLFPNPKNSEQEEKNRRVEINVISMN